MVTKQNEKSQTGRGAIALARLEGALAALTDKAEKRPKSVTASELCRLADVSRNSLYRYHRPILIALRKLQKPQATRRKALRSAEERRLKNACLHARLEKVTALVDHYVTAYREAAALLERRDRELADLRRSSPPELSIVAGSASPRSSR